MKYIEEYLKDIIKVKPLGKLTTEEDELDGISGEMVYIDGKCSNIFISHIDYANWLEKQGNNLVKNGYTKNKDYIRYADKYSHEIWRKLMDNFKNIKDYHIGCNDVSEIVLNAIIDTFNWLEKGGDKNKVSQHVEAINEEKVDDANKVEPKDYNSIDPNFGKSIDKIEPNFNFKAGQWIVATGKCVYLITQIDGFNVTLVDVDGNEYVFDTSSLEDAHLLTIDDVQNGCKFGAKWQGKHDVSEDWSEEDEEHVDSLLKCLDGLCRNEFERTRFAISEDREWLKSLKDRVQPHSKQEWSEEDKSKVQRICKYLDEAKKYYADITEVRECMDWLKSLEDRVGCEVNYTTMWKPSDEQMKALHDLNLTGNISYTGQGQELVTLYNDLKKLIE